MHKATRTQTDDKQDDYARKGGLDCSTSRDMARQEFKNDADVNVILNRFGVDPNQNRPVNYGSVVDYTIDLQQALGAIAQSQDAYNRLSPELKKEYPNWQSLINAMATGKLADHLEKLGMDAQIADEIRALEKRTNLETIAQAQKDQADAIEAIKKGAGAKKPVTPEETPKPKT